MGALLFRFDRLNPTVSTSIGSYAGFPRLICEGCFSDVRGEGGRKETLAPSLLDTFSDSPLFVATTD